MKHQTEPNWNRDRPCTIGWREREGRCCLPSTAPCTSSTVVLTRTFAARSILHSLRAGHLPPALCSMNKLMDGFYGHGSDCHACSSYFTFSLNATNICLDVVLSWKEYISCVSSLVVLYFHSPVRSDKSQLTFFKCFPKIILCIFDQLLHVSKLEEKKSLGTHLNNRKVRIVMNVKFHEHAALVSSLKACAKHKNIYEGARIHADILHRGLLEKDEYLGNALVNLYAKCGVLAKAEEVFNDLPLRNVVSWTSLIAGYAQHGHCEEAMHWFYEMQSQGLFPDAFTFACILKVCSKAGAVDRGEEIHTQITKLGLLENDTFLGNALIDMYVKCGSLSEAQCVFDGIQIQDVVSWTALISGYAQYGPAERALSCYEQMEFEGFSPNNVTHVCILKASASTGVLDKGTRIHAEIVREGSLDKSIELGVALVDMYVKCGALGKAYQVFNQLGMKDVVTWNALIGGYIQEGHDNDALDCFYRMQQESCLPDLITFIGIFKACSSVSTVEKGRQIHAEILSEGLQWKNVLVANALIDMYAKSGVIPKAQKLFDQILIRNVISWNTVIGGYAHHGQGNEALSCFKRMHQEGISANPVTFLSCLKAVGSVGAISNGKEIHTKIVTEELLDEYTMFGNALVDMYAKCGTLAFAEYVFDQLLHRDVVSWSSLISGYAQLGHGEKALQLFRRMQHEGISPNAVTFVCVLKACGSIGSSVEGMRIHTDVVREGLLENNSQIGNALVDMYAKCGELVKARELFDQLSVQDIVSWSALIAGYAQHGHSEEALTIYEQMNAKGLKLDAVTFVWVLKACCKIKASKKGEEIHARIVREGLLAKDNYLGTTLVDMYAKCGSLSKAQEAFDHLHARDVVSWSALIAGYVQYGHHEEALNCYELMQNDGISANEVTFLCILDCCCSLGSVDKGREIQAEICRGGSIGKNILVANALLEMYAKCGFPLESKEMFDQLPIRDAVSWNILMTSQAQLGEDDAVLKLFNQMIQTNIQPNAATFVILLNSCSHSGRLEKGEMCFEAMNTVFGIIPNMEHYTCIVDLFGRGDYMEKATEIVRGVPCADYLPVWMALLSACCRCGDVKLGSVAFGHAVQLDENHAATYVCMRNTYAAAKYIHD